MPRMRTASKAYRLILEQDPDSEITLHYIRHLIASGAVPVIHVGRKKLVDVDQLLAYLAAGNEAPTTTAPAVGYGKTFLTPNRFHNFLSEKTFSS